MVDGVVNLTLDTLMRTTRCITITAIESSNYQLSTDMIICKDTRTSRVGGLEVVVNTSDKCANALGSQNGHRRAHTLAEKTHGHTSVRLFGGRLALICNI